jgi:hypothetical protein
MQVGGRPNRVHPPILDLQYNQAGAQMGGTPSQAPRPPHMPFTSSLNPLGGLTGQAPARAAGRPSGPLLGTSALPSPQMSPRPPGKSPGLRGGVATDGVSMCLLYNRVCMSGVGYEEGAPGDKGD